MNKLLAYHDIEYIRNRRSTSPRGAPYGFANRRDGTLLIESKCWLDDLDWAIAQPQATVGESQDWKYWKFDPEPCSTLRAVGYNLVRPTDDNPKYYERMAARIR